MADLNTLIKYRKHLIDEKQKAVSQLYRDAETIERTKQVVIDQIDREKNAAESMNTPEAFALLGRYLDGARKKIRALDLSLRKMEQRIEAAQEDVRNAFTEMKKIQITQDRRDAEEDRLQKVKEDNNLDSIGIERFARSDQ